MSSEVNKGRFSGTPGSEDTHNNSFARIKSENLMSEGASGGSSPESVVFRTADRIVAADCQSLLIGFRIGQTVARLVYAQFRGGPSEHTEDVSYDERPSVTESS